MNVHTDNVQILKKNGIPTFAVIPYEDYLEFLPKKKDDTVPQEVAEKAGITQAALSQMERAENTNRTTTLEKLAVAMGIDVEQVKD